MGIQIAANDNNNSLLAVVGGTVTALEGGSGDHLVNFVRALARNQARIDHQLTMGAANDNTRH